MVRNKKIINLMLVDEHVILREGLKTLLEATGTFQVIATTSRVEEALNLVALSNVDLVITELEFSHLDGVWLIEQARSAGCDLPILVLSKNFESKYVVKALTAGATGYLTKLSDSSELISSITALSRGGSYIQPQIAHLVVQALRTKREDKSQPLLSEREDQILNLLANGQSNVQIADNLYLSVSSVKTHLRNLYKKLDVNSRTEAVVTAIRLGLLAEAAVQAGA